MPSVLITAGGTGGHIFPALAVASTLRDLGWEVEWLGTADRMEATLVPKYNFTLHTLPVSSVRHSGVLNKLKAGWGLLKSTIASMRLIKSYQPTLVFGFGGYPSAPGGIAATLSGIPLFIHEQNALMGMTNRWLSKVADEVFVAFDEAGLALRKQRRRVIVTGNPLRQTIRPVPSRNYSTPFRLLVVGGSLGARVLNEQVPASIKDTQSITVVHQCGKDDVDAVKARYKERGIDATVLPFLDDIQNHYAWADGIICRAGALTVSEIARVGRAACFVPLPHAADDHQTKNALALVSKQAALFIPQSQLQDKLEQLIEGWIHNPQLCQQMGEKATECLPSNATETIVRACVKWSEESPA